MKELRIIFFLVIAGYSIQESQASDVLKVNVTCSVSGSVLADSFADIPGLEEKLATVFAKFLNEKTPIFHFQANAGGEDTLKFHLESRGDMLYDLFLTIDFSGKHVDDDVVPIEWQLNDLNNRSFEILNQNADIFIENINGRLSALFDRNNIVSELFRKKIIPAEAIDAVDFNGKRWILLLTFEELPIGFDSRIKVIQLYTKADGSHEYLKFFAKVSGYEDNVPFHQSKIITTGLNITSIGDEFVSSLGELKIEGFEKLVGFRIISYQPLNQQLELLSDSGL